MNLVKVCKTIEKNGNGASIDTRFDCGGTGLYKCAAVVNAVKLAVPKSSEKALTNPIKKEFGAIQCKILYVNYPYPMGVQILWLEPICLK